MSLADEKTQEVAERLRRAAKNAPVGMALKDSAGRLLWSNPTLQSLLGYENEELRGMFRTEFTHPGDTGKDTTLYEELLRGERESFQLKKRYVRKDGNFMWGHLSVFRIEDEPDLALVIVEDIDEHKGAEDTLRREYEELLGSVEAIIWKGEAQTLRFTFVSDQAEAILGYPPQRWTEEPSFWSDHIHPEDREWAVSFCRKAIEEKEDHNFEYRMISADGDVVWLRDIVRVGVEDGVPTQLFGVMVDITGRKDAEEALKESEERYRAVMEQSVEAIYLFDVETKQVLESNSTFHKLMGYTEEELLGMEIYDFIDHEKENIDANIRRSLKEKRRHIGERRYRRKDGSIIVVDTSASVISYDGKTALCAVSRDITERKEAEEKLKESERRFRSLIQNASDVVTILEADGTIRYDSPAIERVLGYEPYERVGKSGFDYVHPEDVGRAKHSFAVAVNRPGVQSPVEFRLRHKDGSWRHLEVTRANILDDPAVRGVVVNFHDITERKRAEEALRQSEERYRAVIEQTIEGIYLGAADTKRVLESNAAFQKMLGYTAEELRGIHIYEFVAHDPKNIDSVFQSVLDKGHHFIGERRYRRKDGSTVDVETSSTVISYDNREVLCTVVRDVTERRKAEEALKQREEYFRSLVQNASDVITVLESDGTVRYVSPAIERMLGYTPEGRIGRSGFELLHPDDLPRAKEAFASALRSPGVTISIGLWMRHREGSWRYVELTGTNLLDDPSVRGIVINWRDATERKDAEEVLVRSEERFRALTQNSSDIITLLGAEGIIHYQSPSIERILGYRPEEMVGDNAFDYVHPDDLGRVEMAFTEGLKDPKRRPRAEYRFRHKDGSWRWLESIGTNLLDDLRVGENVVNSRDITERKALEDKLRYQAFHDLLTNLPNRQLFIDRLSQALRRTRRKKGRQVAVLFMDLDDFKAINDSLGHETGDLLLTVVPQRLRRCLRPEDTLARFGGDEFVVIVEDVEAPQDAVRVAERIVEGLREPFVVDGRELFIRTSIGIALGTSRQKSAEDLLRDADTAMYEAKEGQLSYRVFDPAMYERAVGRLEMENELRRSVEAGEFAVHYQPIVSLQTGELWGTEALVRWNHPERGLLDPWEFMAVAEQSGIVVPMGERVLEEACRQAREWQEDHTRIPPLIMSVNLSARQLQRPDIAQIVERVLKRTGLEARCLHLDITETVYIKALEGNTRALDELKRMGVCISIDDFGTGYSSLAYLKRLPANALKIDKSFVKGIGQDLEDTAIVGMVIELAHTLGMEAIAEGVESEAQATLLKEMGCDLAQGFYFSEPLSSETATRFLAEERTS